MPRKWVWAALGGLATGLGLVGIVLPVLPTTPFMLLAAACFMRSSDTMYGWFMSNRLFGGFVRSYREQGGVTPRTKIVALALLWAVIGYTSLAVVTSIWLQVLLACVAIGVTIYLVRLKTIPPQSG
jgi:uncharacterized protein